MKRFIVTLILTVAIVSVLTYSMPRNFISYVEDIATDACVSIYCRNTSVDCINNGTGKIVRCTVGKLKSAISQCSDIDGFSIEFSGTEQDIDRIVSLFDLHICSTLQLNDLLVICGNSARLCGGVLLDGHKVNLQIAYKEGTVTVGSPLILGDY